MRLHGKTALVTGASRGIGRAIAHKFAEEGARVVITYRRSRAQAEELQEEIRRAGSESIALSFDASSEPEIRQLHAAVTKLCGTIDILVNNAGIFKTGPFGEKSFSSWTETVNTNLIGPFVCAQLLAQHINPGGRIINIASTNGIYSTHPESIEYDAAKAGVIAATRSLSQELAPDILVNSIAPGWISTDMADFDSETVGQECQRISLRRFGRPDEVANAALFLASGESSYITGSTLVVDGGYRF